MSLQLYMIMQIHFALIFETIILLATPTPKDGKLYIVRKNLDQSFNELRQVVRW